MYKFLETHTVFNHQDEDHSVFVAIESAEGYWKAYVKRCPRIDQAALQVTAKCGTKLKADRAMEIFPNIKTLTYDD